MSAFRLLLASVAALAPATALGQEAGTESAAAPPLQAKQEFARGDSAFAAGRYEEALVAFQQADALVPSDAVRFNIAVCLERLGRYDAAASDYARVAQSRELSQEVRARARHAAAQLDARLARLVLDVPAAVYTLTIDDVRCSVPCQRRVTPGLHRVAAVTARGEVSRQVVVKAGEVVRIELPVAIVGTQPQPRPKSRPPTATTAQDPPPRAFLGPVGYVGASLMVLGGVGFGYFGLRTNALHEDYRALPSTVTRDAGLEAQLFANVSLGGALLGLSLLALDRLVLK